MFTESFYLSSFASGPSGCRVPLRRTPMKTPILIFLMSLRFLLKIHFSFRGSWLYFIFSGEPGLILGIPHNSFDNNCCHGNFLSRGLLKRFFINLQERFPREGMSGRNSGKGRVFIIAKADLAYQYQSKRVTRLTNIRVFSSDKSVPPDAILMNHHRKTRSVGKWF